MKLRQKLAVVLASAMVVTAVPVVTFADTTNSLHNTVKVVKDSTMGYTTQTIATTRTSYTINSGTGSYGKRYIPNLELFARDSYSLSAEETFFVSLENAEFSNEAFLQAFLNVESTYAAAPTNAKGYKTATVSSLSALGNAGIANLVVDEDGVILSCEDTALVGKKVKDLVEDIALIVTGATTADTATITKTSKDQVRVDVIGNWAPSHAGGRSLNIPLFAKVTKSGDVKVVVDGADSFVTSGTYTVGTANEDNKDLSVTVGDATYLSSEDGGEIAAITITEEVLEGLLATADEDNVLKLELPSSSDLEFDLAGSDIVFEGGRGFNGYGKVKLASAPGARVSYGRTSRNNNTDRQVLEIKLPTWTDNSARGTVKITGIKVVPENKEAAKGDINVQVSGDKFATKSYKVAVVDDYGVTLTCEKPLTIKTGRSGVENDNYVTFQLKENVNDSITEGRVLEFSLDNGYFFGVADIDFSRYTKVPAYNSADYEKEALATFSDLMADKKIKFADDAKEVKAADIKELEINAKGQVVGFTLRDNLTLSATKVNKFTFTMPVAASLNSTGEIKVNVSGRALAQLGEESTVSAKLADVKAPITVETTAAELKVGLQGQSTGTLVIKETDKNMLQKGYIIVDAPEADGIKFATTPKVEAQGVTIGEVTLNKAKTQLYVEVKRTSTEAGSITVSDMAFTTNRSVPEGSFDIEFYGTALTDEAIANHVYKSSSVEDDTFVVEDFIKITTPNTEDIKNGALKAVTSTFTIGSTKYTVDGVEYTMDAQAYAEDGRTMVPVRYIAQAFGIEENNVLFSNGVVTVIAGEKIIQLTIGSDKIVVNGTAIQMDTKTVAKDGRTYVPMSYIAAALGVNVSWDGTAKTATFSNKN